MQITHPSRTLFLDDSGWLGERQRLSELYITKEVIHVHNYQLSADVQGYCIRRYG